MIRLVRTCRLVIRAHNVDNAPTFTTQNRNISQRGQTADSVVWLPDPWTSEGAAGAVQRTPEFKTLMQAVVNLPGWQSGNALALIFRGTGHRTAESYEGNE